VPKMTGAKHGTEALDVFTRGRRASHMRRRRTERSVGAYASDDAGMSNDKQGANPCRRKPKVSSGREFRGGLGGS
jgi:hypothetical protein